MEHPAPCLVPFDGRIVASRHLGKVIRTSGVPAGWRGPPDSLAASHRGKPFTAAPVGREELVEGIPMPSTVGTRAACQTRPSRFGVASPALESSEAPGCAHFGPSGSPRQERRRRPCPLFAATRARCPVLRRSGTRWHVRAGPRRCNCASCGFRRGPAAGAIAVISTAGIRRPVRRGARACPVPGSGDSGPARGQGAHGSSASLDRASATGIDASGVPVWASVCHGRLCGQVRYARPFRTGLFSSRRGGPPCRRSPGGRTGSGGSAFTRSSVRAAA